MVDAKATNHLDQGRADECSAQQMRNTRAHQDVMQRVLGQTQTSINS